MTCLKIQYLPDSPPIRYSIKHTFSPNAKETEGRRWSYLPFVPAPATSLHRLLSLKSHHRLTPLSAETPLLDANTCNLGRLNIRLQRWVLRPLLLVDRRPRSASR